MQTPSALTHRDTQPSEAISFPRLVPDLFKIERQIVESLATQTDSEVLETRRTSKRAGCFAWRVEAACDAQLIANATNVRGRRGVNSGIMWAVRRRAKEIGCTPATIFQNARIFKLIQEVEGAKSENSTKLQALDEKGYYIAALTAFSPSEALLLFADKKAHPGRFRTTDAMRLLQKEGLTKKAASEKAIKTVRDTSLPAREAEVEHILATVGYIEQVVMQKCSSPEIIRIHQSYIEELNAYIEEFLFDEDAATALTDAWVSGSHSEEQLSKATGFPLDIVMREMKMLGGLGKFIEVPGPGSRRWHRVGEVLPAELRRRAI